MVNLKIKIQQAFKEILEQETWKHLKTNNNFDKVLSFASLIEPYNEGSDPCYEDCRGMCAGCYDGYKYSLDWRASYNLRTKEPFSLITDHELDILIDAIDKNIHVCAEWCSDFICYKYEATSCKTWYCENLFLKEKKNIRYCSKCRGLAYI
jgi:hypothetical protein